MNKNNLSEEAFNQSEVVSEQAQMMQEMSSQYSESFNALSLEDKLATLDNTAKDMKKEIELSEAILRLKDNEDFKSIFTEKLFKEEPARLLLLSANFHNGTETANVQLASSKRLSSGIAEIYKWLSLVIAVGTAAEVKVAQLEESRAAVIEMHNEMHKDDEHSSDENDTMHENADNGSDVEYYD